MENKAMSKTEEFKTMLQAKVAEVLGAKVSKQKAWDLFKEMEKAPYAFILNAYEKDGNPEIAYGAKIKSLELPIAGVGTFKVITTGSTEKFSVKGRFYLSSAIDRAIKERLGFEVAADEATEVETEEVDEAPAQEAKASDLDIDL
jgi:hypothetical protein